MKNNITTVYVQATHSGGGLLSFFSFFEGIIWVNDLLLVMTFTRLNDPVQNFRMTFGWMKDSGDLHTGHVCCCLNLSAIVPGDPRSIGLVLHSLDSIEPWCICVYLNTSTFEKTADCESFIGHSECAHYAQLDCILMLANIQGTVNHYHHHPHLCVLLN